MAQPFIKFFPRDWDADMQLLSCSLAARALWLHMLRVMSEAEPFGLFVGRSGEPVDVTAFSRRICAEPREVRKLITELGDAGVYSTDSNGRIYSRRMVRERGRQDQLRENSGLQVVGTKKQVIVPTENHPPVSTAYPWNNHIPETRDPDSLRSSALAVVSWPEDIAGLRALAAIFLARFGNCLDALKAEKYLPAYTQALATMRSRGATIEQAWSACSDALEANGGKPLFSAMIRQAISFLPARAQGRSGKSEAAQYKTLSPGDTA